MLEIPENQLTIIKTELEKALKMVDEKADIRLVLRQNRLYFSRIEIALLAEEKPDNRFIDFIINVLENYIVTMYAKNPEEWYAFNKKNIEDFYPILKRYLQSLYGAIEKKDYTLTINCMNEFFFAFFHHTRLLTES
jgi:hypothetical protein